MEYITLAIFCAALLICLLADISILAALFAGLVLFFIYGICRGCTPGSLIRSALSGVSGGEFHQGMARPFRPARMPLPKANIKL